MADFKRVSISCPKKLLHEFDLTIKGRYASRSAAIQEGMRRLIKEA